MATEEKKVDELAGASGQPAPGGEGAAPQSARDRYRGRYSAAHPDLDLDDEEAFYGQANKNLDELEDFRESNRLLGEAMDKTPLLAGLVLAAKEGENPFVYLAENVGPDMDVRELANNPEFGKKMGEALAKWQENMAKAAKAQQEAGENFAKSQDALKELQQERGMSDEEAQALLKKLYGEVDEEGNVTDPGIIGNASMGIVPKEVWVAVLKAQNYDNDVKAAGDKAAAKALNDKIQNPKKTFNNNGLPGAMPTGGAPRVPGKKKNDGSIEAFRESLGI